MQKKTEYNFSLYGAFVDNIIYILNSYNDYQIEWNNNNEETQNGNKSQIERYYFSKTFNTGIGKGL